MEAIKILIRKISAASSLIRLTWIVETKNWEKVAEVTTKLHEKGYCFNKTRFWLGCALLQLNRNEEALEEFEKIEGRLDTIEEEASRHWNHTLALYRAGRIDDCFELLMRKIDPYWPSKTYNKARQFLAKHGFKAFEINV